MDALWRVRARYEPERNKGTKERVSVFLVLAPIQLDLDLVVRKNVARRRIEPRDPRSSSEKHGPCRREERERTARRFPWWTVFGCQVQPRPRCNGQKRVS